MLTIKKSITKLDIALLTSLIGFTVLITYAYLAQEHTFYYWDYAQYQDMTAAKALYFRDLPKNSFWAIAKAIGGIWKSTAQDYSDFHTLLGIPFILAFGNTRFIYILTLVLLYLLPFSLIMGAIATRLLPFSTRAVFWSTAFLALLTPASWLPTLRGYPDAGSAFLVGCATFAYLQNPKLNRIWQIIVIAFCLTLAILFRRHFVYAGVSFFVAIAVQTLAQFLYQLSQTKKDAYADLLRKGRQIAFTVISTILILAIIGTPFINRIIHTNFGELYSSYEQPVQVSIDYYRAYYGWLACFLTALGMIAGWFTRILNRSAVVFLSSFACFSIVQWLLKVKQLGFHYTLHFTPWIILGLSAFGWTIWSTLKPKKRSLILGLLVAFLSLNMFFSLAPLNQFANNSLAQVVSSSRVSKLFASNYPPQVRSDYTEIANLVTFLRDISSQHDLIYVAGSSAHISDDLLWQANRALYEDVMSYPAQSFWNSKGLKVLHWIPFADSRDPYPLERLLFSKYVVLPTPFQHHLRPEEQDLIKVVVDAFTQGWPIALDFERLPQTFQLEGGVTVSIYQRIRPTSIETALETLIAMEKYLGKRPGGQLSWLALSRVSGYYINRNNDNTYNINFYSEGPSQPTETPFVYLDTPADQVVIKGNASFDNQKCQGLTLNVALVDAQGQVAKREPTTQQFSDSSQFELKIQASNSKYLMLSVLGANRQETTKNQCVWNIANLRVSA